MQITFLGATHEVTGSMTMITTNGHNILVDCGMEQGKDMFVNQPLPVASEKIDCVLLTHAHIDHCGKVPLLYKNGFEGKIYATNETEMLCRIMLLDSAHIQESDAEWKNRKAKRSDVNLVEPMYTTDDAKAVMSLFYPCAYGEQKRILDNVEIRFTDIGHLLGSACIEIWIEENGEKKKIVFSGDVGNINKPIIKNPTKLDRADYLVIESTYGNRMHEVEKNTDNVDFLAHCLNETFAKGGNVVIPSFAVGRTQEMLYFLRQIKEQGLVKSFPDFPVYVDSPLANEATSVFLQCDRACLDAETAAMVDKGINPIYFDGLYPSVSTEESKAINFDKTPKVIISASGMCEAGRIRHHLKHNLWREECLILFVGFQAAGTLGRIIYEGADSVKLFGEEIAVKAKIALLPNASGHADMGGLLDWLDGFEEKPKKVFVNHGEDEVCTSFANTIKEKFGIEAVAPYSGSVYDLIGDEFIKLTEGIEIPHKSDATSGFVSSEYSKLVETANSLMSAVRASKGMANRDLKKFAAGIQKLYDEFKINQ